MRVLFFILLKLVEAVLIATLALVIVFLAHLISIKILAYTGLAGLGALVLIGLYGFVLANWTLAGELAEWWKKGKE